jgi:PAS domain S-box-containing protein
MTDEVKSLEELQRQVAALRQENVGCSSEIERLQSVLQATEIRHKVLLHNLPEKLFWKDRQLIYVACNQNYADDFGITPEQIAGKTDYDFYSAELAEKYRADDRRIMDSGTAEEIEESYRIPDGRRFIVRTVKAPLKDQRGNSIGILGIFADVTARREAELALRERESQLREAQEIARLGFYVLDVAAGRWKSSRVLDQIFDIAADYPRTVEGWGDLVHPDERQAMSAYFSREVIGEKKPFDREYRIIRHGDQRVRWVHGRGRLQVNEDGQPLYMLGTIQDITERKEAQLALQQAHDGLEDKVLARTAELAQANECLSIFRMFADASGEGFAMTGLDGHLTYLNPSLCHLYGEDSPEDAVGKHVSTYYPEEYRRRREQEILPALMREGYWQGEQIVISRRGEATPTLQSNFLIRDSSGEPVRLAAVITDITERKRAEEQVLDANRKLVATLESIADGFVSFDRQWRYTYVNEAAARSLHASADELLGKVLWEAWPEAVRSKHFSEYHRAVRDNVSVHFEEFYPEPLNRWYECHAYPSAEGLSLYFRDVTERRQAEDAVRRNQEQYRGLVEACPDAVVMSDLDGRILFASGQTWRLLGLAESDALAGRSVFDYVIEDDRRRLAANISHLVDVGVRRNTEYRALRKNGTVFPAEASSTVICDAQGRPKAVMAVIRDISERKKAEESLERQRQSLWHMLQASDHERQTISYEIHDGLAQYLAAAGMQFQSHDALKDVSPHEASKAYQTAVELVRQAHVESRRLISEVRPPVIDEIGLETALSHLVHEQRRHGGPKIKFDSDVQFGRLPSILENALYRMAQEALTNACKHSRSEKVTLTLDQEGHEVRLEVRDWGIGFDPEAVESGHFGLEGIRQRARLLGGRLTIQSAAGSGTLVQVVVPIVERQSEG